MLVTVRILQTTLGIALFPALLLPLGLTGCTGSSAATQTPSRALAAHHRPGHLGRRWSGSVAVKFYTSEGAATAHVLQFDPGDLLLEGIREFIAASGIRTGAVVSGVGTLRDATMHMVTTTGFPPVEVFPVTRDTALELISLQGVIADGVPHIHMTVSTERAAVGGHLEEGCVVLYLAEVVVLEFSGLSLTRVKNDRDIFKIVEAGAN